MRKMDASGSGDGDAQGADIGIFHTPAWAALHGGLKRLFDANARAGSRQEREQLNSSFSATLIEKARKVAAEYSPSSSPSSQHGQQLDGLAILAVASMFDTALAQQTSTQVRSLLLSGPLAKEDASLSSAWQLFMQQASATLGLRPTLSAAAAPAAALPTTWELDSPDPPRRALSHAMSNVASPLASRMQRNTSELFIFEQ